VTVLRGLPLTLRTAAAVLLPVVAACACSTAAPPEAPHASAPARPPPTASQPAPPAASGGCQDTYVPSMFYASSDWAQAIDTKPAPRRPWTSTSP